MKRRIILLCFALLVVPIILGGCGEKDTMDQAKSNIKDITSASAISTTEIVVVRTEGGEKLPLEVKMEAANEFTTDPVGFSSHIKTSTNNSNPEETLSYCVVEDGSLMHYYNHTGSQWYKEEVLKPWQVAISTDSPNTIEPYLLTATDLIQVGEEDINGRKAIKFTGVIKGAAMETFNGLLDNITTSSLGLEPADSVGLHKNADDINISFWIDKQQYLPLRYELDATSYVASLLQEADKKGRIKEDTSYKVEKYTVSVNITGYNNIDSIELPPGAKDAKKVDN